MAPHRPQLADVAAAADVSIAAASLALNGRPGVSDQTRERILSTAKTLGYRPAAAAKALRTGRTTTLGLLSRNLSNPFFLDVIRGFEERAAESSYGVLISSADYEPSIERRQVDLFIERNVDGLAIAPIGGTRSHLRWRSATGRPVVLINAANAAGPRSLARVHPDNEQAVTLAVEHLIELGHERIALVAAPRRVSADPERLDTFVELAERWRFEAHVIEAALRLDTVEQATSAALASTTTDRPTAVIVNADHLATAVYRAARNAELDIGNDLSVVGHDDLPYAEFLRPSLTTIRVDRRAIGRAAAEALIAAIEGQPIDAGVVVPTELIARSSSGPIPPPVGS